MNKLKITFYILLTALILPFSACKDEALNPVPDWESGVHALGQFTASSAQNFVFGQPSVDIDVEFHWVSIDNLNTVTEVEFYILFNESYSDNDGNPRVARHGGTDGKLLKKLTGAEVKGNREFVNISVTQADIYDLYKDNTFDYGDGVVGVFANPEKPTRTPDGRFIAGDAFELRWAMRTADGRYFDSWSPSVCSEFPGASCSVGWGTICVSDLARRYSVTTTYSQHDFLPDFATHTMEVDLVELSAATYFVQDLSGGLYTVGPYVGAYGTGPDSFDAQFVDGCGQIQLFGQSDPWGEVVINGPSSVNPATGVITISWKCLGYNEAGVSVYTPL